MISHHLRLAGFLLSAAAAAALFASTITHPFFYDDIPYVVKNPAIRSLTLLPHAWTEPFSPTAPGLYRPVTTAAYSLEYALFGLDPRGYHATNILLHALVSGLLFLLAFRLLKNFWGALLSSLLFAVHPVHTEAVAWVAGQSELLAALFALLSILSFLHFLEGKGGKRILFLTLAGVSYAAAVLSKEIAAPLPLILPFIERLTLSSFMQKRPLAKHVLLYGVFALALLFALILRFIALGAFSVPLSQVRTAGLSLLERMLLMLPVVVHYLRLLLLPTGLRIEYDWATFPLWMSLSAAFLLFGIGALTIFCFRTGRPGSTGSPQVRAPLHPVGFGILWFFLFLLPVANIIPIGELIAERFLYLPSVGFCLLAGGFFVYFSTRISPNGAGNRTHAARPAKPFGRAIIQIFLLSFFVFFSFLTVRRTAEWRDPEVLWRSTLTLSPNAPHALQNLTAILLARGELQESGQLLERGFARFPESPLFYFQGGQWAIQNNDRARAERLFTEALRLAGPEDIGFTALQRGIAFLELGRTDDALTMFEEAFAENPSDPVILNNLGVVHANKGNFVEAREFFTKAIALFEAESSLSEEDEKNLSMARENLEMLTEALSTKSETRNNF